MADRLEDLPIESLAELDYILRGDYMELDDLLVDPESPSSSSDNTSCLSFTSEECFDALALLKDLEQGKETSFKYTASASAKPREVVMHPPTLGMPIISLHSHSCCGRGSFFFSIVTFGMSQLRVQFPFWAVVNVPNFKIPKKLCFQPSISLKLVYSLKVGKVQVNSYFETGGVLRNLVAYHICYFQ